MVRSRATIAAVCAAAAVGVLLVCAASLHVPVADGLAARLRGVRTPVELAAAAFGLLALAASARRLHNRRVRPMARYRLALSQSDEASFEHVASAYEQLVQTVRVARVRRCFAGQPWLALESWFLPADEDGETGAAVIMLVCEPALRDSALAALRHAYPDLTLHAEVGEDDATTNRLPRDFVADHVMRVRKARSWALPIGSLLGQDDASNARSTMAAVIRQQQQGGRLSCVRWCLMPAAERLDNRATRKLEGLEGPQRRTAISVSSDVTQASRTAGGAMCSLELQAAVRAAPRPGSLRRRESLLTMHAACRQLLSPALSQRGANHLRERLMLLRQGLYRRRWRRAEPPLLPDVARATLVSPRELAVLMALPSLGSEHALPLQRNTVPYLPIPVDVPRARTADLPTPPASVTALRGAHPGRPASILDLA